MDVNKALRQLYEEKKRLDDAIRALEGKQRTMSEGGAPARSRRGRKSMSAEERLEVSRRMSAYWANRRSGAGRSRHPDSSESAMLLEQATA
jgi:hypothetical protein